MRQAKKRRVKKKMDVEIWIGEHLFDQLYHKQIIKTFLVVKPNSDKLLIHNPSKDPPMVSHLFGNSFSLYKL